MATLFFYSKEDHGQVSFFAKQIMEGNDTETIKKNFIKRFNFNCVLVYDSTNNVKIEHFKSDEDLNFITAN